MLDNIQLLFLWYSRRVQNRLFNRKQRNLKECNRLYSSCLVIVVFSLACIKKTLFCQFVTPMLHLKTIKILPLQTKENNRNKRGYANG